MNVYADGRYAELALGLHLSGWRDRASGLLNPVVQALHDRRVKSLASRGKSPPPAPLAGLFHQSLALDPLFGAEFRRSAGISKTHEPSMQCQLSPTSVKGGSGCD